MPTKFLSDAEWEKIVPPFHHITLKSKHISKIHKDIIQKWIELHCGDGFVYNHGDMYVFGSEADFIVCKMWLMSDPFSEDGTII